MHSVPFKCRLWVFQGLEVFRIAVCLGLTSVRLPFKGRTKETVAAPVVRCSCCVVGLAPARTAAVWLSVWTAGITGKPFTLAQAAVCSPSPSVLIHSEISALSFLFLLFASSAYRPVVHTPDCYLPLFILCIPQSVCLCFCPLSTHPPLTSFCLFLPFNSH